MNTKPQFPASLACAAILAILALGGCNDNVGWVVQPVPLDRALEETLLARDEGWGVDDKIVVIDVDGILINERRGGLFGEQENPVSLFVEKLDRAQMDPHVRALVLRINSPGGGVTASDIMYERLRRFRAARRVPVVAIIEDVGASGGYDSACGADVILAHPTSVTGSIGVMVQTVSFAGTMDKIGITAQAVTSGPFKDMASPLHPLRERDIEILQQLVDEFYGRFLDVVQTGRPDMEPQRIRELADGRIYTAAQALDNGLIDATGYVQDAIAVAKRLSGADRVQVVMYHRPLGYRANVYSQTSTPMPQVNLINISAGNVLEFTRPRFFYLWSGHSYGE